MIFLVDGVGGWISGDGLLSTKTINRRCQIVPQEKLEWCWESGVDAL